MKNKIEQFKTIVKSEISDIDIGYKKFEDGYIQIYYYSEIDNDGIFNIGLRKISKERIKEYFPEKNDILNFYTILEFEEILNTFSKTFKKNIASNYTDTYFAINKYNNMKLNKRSKLNKTKYNKPNIIYSNFS